VVRAVNHPVRGQRLAESGSNDRARKSPARRLPTPRYDPYPSDVSDEEWLLICSATA
jgi:hypothetical protein